MIVPDRLGRLLIVVHRNANGNIWNLPGGKVEVGESPEEAAKRELYEETGLRPETLTFLHQDSFKFGSDIWKGYFFSAEPCRNMPRNREPDKFSSVGYRELKFFKKHKCKAFVLNVVDLIDGQHRVEAPCQLRLQLTAVSATSTER